MFGVRFASGLLRTASRITSQPVYIPKCEFSLLNKQTTSLIMKTSLLPSNVLIKNLLEMVERLSVETDPQTQCDVKTISLLSQVTLRMSPDGIRIE